MHVRYVRNDVTPKFTPLISAVVKARAMKGEAPKAVFVLKVTRPVLYFPVYKTAVSE